MNSEKKAILETLAFFSIIKRPLTYYELWRILAPEEKPENLNKLLSIIHELEEAGLIRGNNHFLLTLAPEATDDSLTEHRLLQGNLLSEKWSLILRYRFLFDWIPFVNFSLISGSMAIGNVTENSDSDVIISCAKNRVFTARLATIFIFELWGRRRKKTHSKIEAKNKFCFNHFVTEEKYSLSPPHEFYWHILYRNLIPIYGDEDKIIKFFKANDWAKRGVVVFDNRFLSKTKNPIRLFLELILKTPIGSLIEALAKKIQTYRFSKITPHLNKNHSRFYISDEELELHLDTTTIERIEAELTRVLQIFIPHPSTASHFAERIPERETTSSPLEFPGAEPCTVRYRTERLPPEGGTGNSRDKANEMVASGERGDVGTARDHTKETPTIK